MHRESSAIDHVSHTYPRRLFIGQVSAAVVSAFSGVNLPAAFGRSRASLSFAELAGGIASLIRTNHYLCVNEVLRSTKSFFQSSSPYRVPFQNSSFKFTGWVSDALEIVAEVTPQGVPCVTGAKQLVTQLSDEELITRLLNVQEIRRAHLDGQYGINSSEAVPADEKFVRDFDDDLRREIDFIRGEARYFGHTWPCEFDSALDVASEVFSEGRPCLGFEMLQAMKRGELTTFISNPSFKALFLYYKEGGNLLSSFFVHEDQRVRAEWLDDQAIKFQSEGVKVPLWREEVRGVLGRIRQQTGALEHRLWQCEGCFDGISELRSRVEWLCSLGDAPLIELLNSEV